ncbi:uncharacterized protein LOC127876153 isoform X2 [Dreissena polymorpha]|uniref:uncharacterized protein LOC127876153 isoform X2 n=1 Tax=Dreissena polymorpha TaxID=45954 RepID=UPI00226528D8|nr:uncharacterized protein LOC127876153 isoform X2 [Dreissena polymorpha]
MTSYKPISFDREYTLEQINWKRSMTEIDLKRRRADMRERDRMQIKIITKLDSPTLGFEVENFRLFNRLRKTETAIHNTIPTLDTVNAEKDYITFERLRKSQPHAVTYTSFYNTIQGEARKPRTPKTPSAIAYSGIELSPSSARSRGTLRRSSQSLSESPASRLFAMDTGGRQFNGAYKMSQSTPIDAQTPSAYKMSQSTPIDVRTPFS